MEDTEREIACKTAPIEFIPFRPFVIASRNFLPRQAPPIPLTWHDMCLFREPQESKSSLDVEIHGVGAMFQNKGLAHGVAEKSVYFDFGI